MSNNDENKNLKNEEDILDTPSANRITFYYKNLDGTVEYTPHITKVNTRLYLISSWSNDFTADMYLVESPHDRYMTCAGMGFNTNVGATRAADRDPVSFRSSGNPNYVAWNDFGVNNRRFYTRNESDFLSSSAIMNNNVPNANPGTVLTDTISYSQPAQYGTLHYMEEVNGDGSGNRPIELTFTMKEGLNRTSIDITHLRFKVTGFGGGSNSPLNSNRGCGFAAGDKNFNAFEITSYETSDGTVHNMSRQQGQWQGGDDTGSSSNGGVGSGTRHGVPFDLNKLDPNHESSGGRNRLVWKEGSSNRSMEVNTAPHYHLSGHIGFFYFDSHLGFRKDNNVYSTSGGDSFGTVSGTGHPRWANTWGYRNWWLGPSVSTTLISQWNNSKIFMLYGSRRPYSSSQTYGLHNGTALPVWYAMNFDTVITAQPKTIDPFEFTGTNIGDYYFIDSYDITHHRSDGDFRYVNLFYSYHSDIINNEGPSLYNNKDNIEFITIPSYFGNKIYSVNIDEYEYNSSYTWYELNLRDLDGNSVQDGFLDQNIPIIVYAFKIITKPTINNISFNWGSVLNINESNNTGIVTVTTTDVENGQNLTITLNGISYENTINNNSTTISINNLNSINLTDGASYTITANVTNAPGIAADQATSSSFTIDFSPPVISITGVNPVSIELGSTTTYVDQGATATGHVGSVDTSGTVNLDSVGPNTITYTATDAEGNVETSTRIVNIVDTTNPVVTVVGDNPYILLKGTTFYDPSAVATDASGEISVVTTGSVNKDVSADYTLTYTATDASNNSGTGSRIVSVVDNLPEFNIDSVTYSWDFRINSSSYQNFLNATYNGGMTSTFDNGALLDGTDDYISLGNFELGGDPFTIETYFKVNASNLYGRIFQFGASNDNIGRISLYRATNEDRLSLHIRDDQGSITGSSASNLSNNLEINYEWQHLVMVYSESNLKIYMNGNLVSDITLSRPINRTTRTHHTIGSNVNQEFNSMNIKFFRIWDGVALKQYNVDYLFSNKEQLVFQYPRVKGDVNKDGFINDDDVEFLGGYLVGVTYIKEAATEDTDFVFYADANENDKVDVGDIVVISNIINS